MYGTIEVIPTEKLGKYSRAVTHLDEVKYLINDSEYTKLLGLVVKEGKKQAYIYFNYLINEKNVEIDSRDSFIVENNFNEVFEELKIVNVESGLSCE